MSDSSSRAYAELCETFAILRAELRFKPTERDTHATAAKALFADLVQFIGTLDENWRVCTFAEGRNRTRGARRGPPHAVPEVRELTRQHDDRFRHSKSDMAAIERCRLADRALQRADRAPQGAAVEFTAALIAEQSAGPHDPEPLDLAERVRAATAFIEEA